MITREQKREAADRELRLRLRVYPRRIDDGKMTKAEAEHEVACMRAMLADYQPRDMLGEIQLVDDVARAHWIAEGEATLPPTAALARKIMPNNDERDAEIERFRPMAKAAIAAVRKD